MSNNNLSLDAIIAKTKTTKKVRGQAKSFKTGKASGKKISGGIKKRTNAPKKENLFTKAVPTGKWKHDKFASLEKTPTKPFKSTFLNSFVDGNKKVRLNISNLAATVSTADLKELFSPYSISSAFVHYGENGEALGTGEVAMKKKDAQKAINNFKGVSVDGSRIRLAIVDAGESIFNRVQMVKKVGGGAIKKRTVNPRPPKARVGKKADEGRLFSLDISNVTKSSKGRGKGGKIPKKAMNEEELDAELDQYMKKADN